MTSMMLLAKRRADQHCTANCYIAAQPASCHDQCPATRLPAVDILAETVNSDWV